MTARQTGIDEPLDSAVPEHGVDRRRARRIDAQMRASVRIAELDARVNPVSRARVRDISISGARLLLRRRLPVGASVRVDLECELPLRVHLGFDANSLVVNGPVHTHVVCIAGSVTHIERLPNRLFEVGIEFCEQTTRFDELQVIKFYVDHLREQEEGFF